MSTGYLGRRRKSPRRERAGLSGIVAGRPSAAPICASTRASTYRSLQACRWHPAYWRSGLSFFRRQIAGTDKGAGAVAADKGLWHGISSCHIVRDQQSQATVQLMTKRKGLSLSGSRPSGGFLPQPLYSSMPTDRGPRDLFIQASQQTERAIQV